MFVLNAKHILAYAGLPQVKMRLETLFTSGFQFIAYFMALVYSAVGLLPPNHPYTNSTNLGKFGIHHVVAEAANNLVFKKENADQIILFIALLIGLVLIFLQISLLAVSMFMQPVFAGMPTNFAGFFLTPAATETTDIAYIMMDLVFGVGDGNGNNLFNSCVAQMINCTETLPSPATGTRDVMIDSTGNSIYAGYGFPFPIHHAMHQMFQLYNTGLLVVAALITSYFIITIIAETAQTGTAFGKRFNKVWAPIRIVFAFGLLIPVGIGFNSSQYAVLYAAKFGSGFATNGWNLFNASITGGYFGDMKDLVSSPNVPEVGSLLQFFYTARTCQAMEEAAKPGRSIKMYIVRGTNSLMGGTKYYEVLNSTTYQTLNSFTEQSGTIKIRFGEQNDVFYSQHLGTVNPLCGEIIFKLTDARDPSATGPSPGGVLDKPEAGMLIMQEYYWYLLKDLWFNFAWQYPRNLVVNHSPWNPTGMSKPQPEPNSTFRTIFVDFFRSELEAVMLNPGSQPIGAILGITNGAIPALQASARYNVNNLVTEKGWAGAAIWYNRIAEMNGGVTTAVLNIPYPTLYPDVMEQVLKQKKLHDRQVPFDTRYLPILSNGDPIQFAEAAQASMADVLWKAYNFWQADNGTATSHAAPTGNAMIDSINALFGTEGLYNIRRNPDTHPLALLVGIGRSLVESSIRNLTISVIGGVGGKLLGFLDNNAKELVGMMGKFLITVTMVSLTAGFVLFYVVPFLPFIYFFFAVGGWIKGIFEAMVGAPLWALAHIRIDQNGLPGQAAVAGYFLIFEVFLRPILIIFGMLASISIFAALVSVLNQVFDLVTNNVGGFDYRAEAVGTVTVPTGAVVANPSSISFARSAIDEFFFTIIYTIVVYLMAMSSFKLIDLIPNNILRWMGQSVATFNDQSEDAAQGLVGKATVGSQQTSSALQSGLQSLTGG